VLIEADNNQIRLSWEVHADPQRGAKETLAAPQCLSALHINNTAAARFDVMIFKVVALCFSLDNWNY
jgi:hypothetical protein